MKWIRAGRQIGQAVKNAQRLRTIVGVFARRGFVDVVERVNLQKFLPSRLANWAESQADLSMQERLRLSFEELGPTFVKLGQLLSTRPDLLPEAYIDEFRKLQDNVQPLPFEIVKSAIESELKKPISEVFAVFEEQPLAAASIGQVHAAVLPTGENVVVKVQRPEIAKIIDVDISLLAFLAGLLEKYVPESQILNPKVVVDEFFRTLSFELDYIVEANNIARMTQNLSSIPEIVIPKVYKHCSTKKVLTLEKLEGIRLNDIPAMDRAGIDRKQIVSIGARAFFKTVMIDGLFHGDLHGGNLFVLPGNRLGIIDFGIVGRLSEKSRDQLASMVMALLTEDYENLCYQYAELGASGASIDFDGFQRETRNTLSPYMGLKLADLNAGRVLIEATRIAAKYNIKIPGDWMIVFKALFTIEGMGRSLDPEFDLLETGKDLIGDIVKRQYSVERFSKDFLWVARDLGALMQILPRHLRWMLKKLNANDFALEIKSPELRQVKRQLDINGRRQSLSILIAGLFVSSSIALNYASSHRVFDYPVVAVFYFVIGLFLLFQLFLKSFK